MTEKVIFTTQTKSWDIVCKIDLHDGVTYPPTHADSDEKISAHINVHSNESETQSTTPSVTVRPVEEVPDSHVTINELTSPKTNSALSEHKITTTHTPTKTPVNVSVEGNTTQSCIVSIPRIHFLNSLKEIRGLNPITPEEVTSIIEDNYPQNNTRTAANKFVSTCIETTPPDEHLPITDSILTQYPTLINYRDSSKEYVSNHAFEIGKISYNHIETGIESLSDFIQLYNQQYNFPEVTKQLVIRYGLFTAIDKNSLDMLNQIKKQLIGDTWNEILSDYNQYFLTVLLVGNGYIKKAKNINTCRDWEYMHTSEYEELKEEIQQYPDTKQAEAWGELLPIAVNNHPEDFRFVVANLAYWLAGDLNSKHDETKTASEVYSIAEKQLREHASDHYAAVAKLRSNYTEGLHHREHQRREKAKEKFKYVVDNWNCSPKKFSDAYSVFGAIEQLTTLTILDWSEKDDITIEETLDKLESIESKVPSRTSLPSSATDRKNTTERFLQAALAEFTGRKLRNTSAPDEAPIDTQIRKQFQTAAAEYEATQNPRDENRVKDLLHNISIAQ